MDIKNLFDAGDQVEEMDPLTSIMCINCTLAASDGDPPMTGAEILARVEELDKDNVVAMLFAKRLALTEGVQYSFYTAMFVALLSTRAAMSVMWAWSLYDRTKALGRMIEMKDLGDIAPNGFADEDYQRECWMSQKGDRNSGIDNRLDGAEAWA